MVGIGRTAMGLVDTLTGLYVAYSLAGIGAAFISAWAESSGERYPINA
ncbi:MAG: hypothetical protein PWP45_1023 [Tepidanaerobacteraceae bacterium]|nr:hypothetical protein [Tepidanaerobacteraceae bacterium]